MSANFYLSLLQRARIIPRIVDGHTNSIVKRKIAEVAHAGAIAGVSQQTIDSLNLIIDENLNLYFNGQMSSELVALFTAYASTSIETLPNSLTSLIF